MSYHNKCCHGDIRKISRYPILSGPMHVHVIYLSLHCTPYLELWAFSDCPRG